jgi:hypothetical protein
MLIVSDFERRLEPFLKELMARLQELIGRYGTKLPDLRLRLGEGITMTDMGIDPLKKSMTTLGVGAGVGFGLSVGVPALAAAIMPSGIVGFFAAMAAAPVVGLLAGPVAIAAVVAGVVATPFAFHKALQKNNDSLPLAARQFIDDLVDQVRNGRLKALRGLCEVIVREVKSQAEKELARVEASLKQARDHRPSPETIILLQQADAQWKSLLDSARLPGSSLEAGL